MILSFFVSSNLEIPISPTQHGGDVLPGELLRPEPGQAAAARRQQPGRRRGPTREALLGARGVGGDGRAVRRALGGAHEGDGETTRVTSCVRVRSIGRRSFFTRSRATDLLRFFPRETRPVCSVLLVFFLFSFGGFDFGLLLWRELVASADQDSMRATPAPTRDRSRLLVGGGGGGRPVDIPTILLPRHAVICDATLTTRYPSSASPLSRLFFHVLFFHRAECETPSTRRLNTLFFPSFCHPSMLSYVW